MALEGEAVEVVAVVVEAGVAELSVSTVVMEVPVENDATVKQVVEEIHGAHPVISDRVGK
jgi:hypothetical protein